MVSIIMPAFNRATTLPRAIDSVLRQTFADWELIVVDDGSTDETLEILAHIEDPRIRTYRHPQNRGVTAAKNTGLDQIHGDWFTLLDSDDEMVPDALAVMLECAERTGANAVTCNCLDSVTGRMTGVGLAHDGRLPAQDAAKCRGEFWGLTGTSLLGDLRFDESLPGFESTVWLQIDRTARRYYVHRALRIYHSEGADRVWVAGHQRGVRDNVLIYSAIGQNRAYLNALKATDCRGFRQMMLCVWAARLLRPVIREAKER
jgi:glycosyltransferase involved in cell wall biosynthesis